MAERGPGDLTLDQFREVILGSYEEVRTEFTVRFGPGIENFTLLTHKVYRQIQTMESRVPYEDRSAWTYQFLYVALNHLVSGFHLQISGFLVPSGNLMRQFGEALAMALLCSHRKINVFDRFIKEKEKFPAHKSLEMVRKGQNRKLLQIDRERWDELEAINRFYDHLSHPGLYGSSALEVFSHPSAKSLGGSFDARKVEFYDREIRLSLTAAMLLREVAQRCEDILNEGQAQTGDERNVT